MEIIVYKGFLFKLKEKKSRSYIYNRIGDQEPLILEQVKKSMRLDKKEIDNISDLLNQNKKISYINNKAKLVENRMILSQRNNDILDEILFKIENIKLLREITNEKSERIIINLYGPPGTGKTATAKYISDITNRDLAIMDLSNCFSKWQGETSKNIIKFIDDNKDKIILFDEAEILLKQRNSDDKEFNLNSLLSKLDSHQGIVIFTTNLFDFYDSAIKRRIDYNLEFELPSKELIKEMYQKYIPSYITVSDIDNLVNNSLGLSGGDIIKICDKALISIIKDVKSRYNINSKENFIEIVKEMSFESKFFYQTKQKKKVGLVS